LESSNLYQHCHEDLKSHQQLIDLESVTFALPVTFGFNGPMETRGMLGVASGAVAPGRQIPKGGKARFFLYSANFKSLSQINGNLKKIFFIIFKFHNLCY
jgi:hypothetical protein